MERIKAEIEIGDLSYIKYLYLSFMFIHVYNADKQKVFPKFLPHLPPCLPNPATPLLDCFLDPRLNRMNYP